MTELFDVVSRAPPAHGEVCVAAKGTVYTGPRACGRKAKAAFYATKGARRLPACGICARSVERHGSFVVTLETP